MVWGSVGKVDLGGRRLGVAYGAGSMARLDLGTGKGPKLYLGHCGREGCAGLS